MFSVVRRRLTYANVAMTLALVFAMSGGAYAASKFVITSTKQIKPSVLASLKGANGKNGAAGAAGPAGPAGAAGAKGETGPAGAIGETGGAGPQGPAGPAGAAGKAGKEGSPWTAGGTLPAGKTETGTWGFSSPKNVSGVMVESVASFSIPLAAPLSDAGCEKKEEPCQAHFINRAGEEVTEGGNVHQTKCTGTEENPTAEPGNLCVYEDLLANTVTFTEGMFQSLGTNNPGASKVGAVLEFLYKKLSEPGDAQGDGTFAVTAGSE